MRTKRILAMAAVAFVLLFSGFTPFAAAPVYADDPTDLIKDYEITADVNEDATVTLHYHFDWEVLESDGIGPVSWLQIGIPNGAVISYDAFTDNISYLEISNDYGGHYVYVYFEEEYYEGTVISFDFEVVQDYMYQVGFAEENHATYTFTPGWFNEIAIENLTVRWNADEVIQWNGDCFNDGGYLVWEFKNLSPGDRCSVRVDYDAVESSILFDTEKYILSGDQGGYIDDTGYWTDYDYDEGDAGDVLLGGLVFFGFWGYVISKIVNSVRYKSGSGLNAGAAKAKTMVTRTKITYYPSCQGCGAPREGDETKCKYCGRSFVKSEEVVKEEQIPEEDKEVLKEKKSGVYHGSSSPNISYRVNVVNVPPLRTSHSSAASHGGSGSSHHSSCAHSSCACACASCACACACACAGGGRAGCTTKDFYNTNLKLAQLEKYKK